ncbi:hypothetical protein [Streptobacillus ratti]|uniref:hypothetical protein n=1 Tax=Streptobacillus ratti TaxID=1720557 RepID=UPI0009348364|nr:hypothetical protein [Streptobacillus ratti]
MKKLILITGLLIGLVSLPIELTGPRYRIEGILGAGYKPDPHDENDKNFKGNYINVDVSLGFSPEWMLKINDKFDITFGPKITTSIFTSSYKLYDEYERRIFWGIGTGIRVDFNYTVTNNIKLYTGIETLATVRPDIHVSKIMIGGSNIELLVHPTILGKFSIGTKIKKYNVGLYTEFGLNKELVGGLEVGYTF